MEKAFQKLIRRIILPKYPYFYDILVQHIRPYPVDDNYYEVFIIVPEKERAIIREKVHSGDLRNSIRELGKYLEIKVLDIYYEFVSEEEWEAHKEWEEKESKN